jgi:hypothetical protein
MLERGRAHPILGPLVLILLVLLLAMVFMHTAIDGHDTATEAGIFCLAILVLIGSTILDQVRRAVSAVPIRVRGDRGPPRCAPLCNAPPGRVGFIFAPPLRR